MLLVEWHSWWAAIPGIEAERLLGLHPVLLASDSGWKLDREGILNRLRELAAGANPMVRVEDDLTRYDPKDPWGIRRQMRRVAAWLRHEYSGSRGGTIETS